MIQPGRPAVATDGPKGETCDSIFLRAVGYPGDRPTGAVVRVPLPPMHHVGAGPWVDIYID